MKKQPAEMLSFTKKNILIRLLTLGSSNVSVAAAIALRPEEFVHGPAHGTGPCALPETFDKVSFF